MVLKWCHAPTGPCNPIPVVLTKQLYVSVRYYTFTHILNHTAICMKVPASVALAVWLASPVTCQSATVHKAPPPSSTCQRGGTTEDKARVTDSDRPVIPAVRRGQGAVSPCVTLSDTVESCALGGVMQPDRSLVHDTHARIQMTEQMHTFTHACTTVCAVCIKHFTSAHILVQ